MQQVAGRARRGAVRGAEPVTGYSQYGEDLVYVPRLPEHGRLLDIGAGLPTDLSNSRILIEKGWEAVLVEPSPTLFMSLFAEYRSNERVQLANCAVGSEWGLKRFHYTEDMLSSTNEEHRERWQTFTEFLGAFTVAIVPLSELTAGAHFDFISIDVEGDSGILIEAALLAQPQIVMIEHKWDTGPRWIMERAPGYGRLLDNGVNLLLERRQEGMLG